MLFFQLTCYEVWRTYVSSMCLFNFSRFLLVSKGKDILALALASHWPRDFANRPQANLETFMGITIPF
jgi:hypothetical protein